MRLKQRIRFPLFERLFPVEFPFCVVPAGGEGPFCVVSAGGEGVGECYTLAERYGERIRCFTLTLQMTLKTDDRMGDKVLIL